MTYARWTSFLALNLAMACSGSSSDEPKPASGGKGGAGGSTAGTGASGKGTGGSSHAGSGGSGGSGAVAGHADAGGSGGSGGDVVAGRGGSAQAGGSGRGGAAGHGATAGSGGQTTEPGGAGGEAGSPSACTRATTTQKHSMRARSSGFSGTEAQYDEIYDLDCQMTSDCQTGCMDRGGTAEMCADTICEMSTTNYCLPTPIWTGLNALSAEGTDPFNDAAQIVLWSYPYHDTLLLDQFKLEVPAGAEVLGITATIRRAGDAADEAVDSAVRLIKHGVVGSTDRSSATPWSAPDFVNVDYGGPKDLWGETWTADDLNADDFGVALAAAYTQTAGSGRGYVDIVYVTVTYQSCP
jgi:hypothetical protein